MANISRRKFLKLSAGVIGAQALAPLVQPRFTAQAAPAGSLNDIKHVVIFMNENRSFDHYFGTLSGVRGFADPNAIKLAGGKSVFYQPSKQNKDGYVLPFRLDSKAVAAQCLADQNHAWNGQHRALNNGKMDGWMAAEQDLAMGYFAREDLPFHYALADAFTICDGYHCSVLGPTDPNRLYLWTGMIDPSGTAGGPVIDNNLGSLRWTTYPERLEKAGISWRVYQEADNFDDNALAWFDQFKKAPTSSPLYKNGMVHRSATAFQEDVANGLLPQVSWIVAPTDQSEHPPATPAAGADYAHRALKALADAPEVWKSTAFLYCYDENDGLFDHVVPPLPPAGTPDEFVNNLPIGLGFRVPMIVISPFSRGGWVCSDTFDHTSILMFLEKRFGVKEPNISAWRRSVCGDLTSAFDFTKPDYTFPPLPDTAAAARTADKSCTALPNPAVPARQSVPTPESGTRPRRGKSA